MVTTRRRSASRSTEAEATLESARGGTTGGARGDEGASEVVCDDKYDGDETTSRSGEDDAGDASHSSSFGSFSRHHVRYAVRVLDDEGASAGATLGSLASRGATSDFSNWLRQKAAESDRREKMTSKIISFETFCVALVMTAVVTRSFFQCDATMIVLSCATTAWVFKTRDSSPRFGLAANTFFTFVQLIYCEPIHSLISTDGLSSAERFYGVPAKPGFRAMSSYICSSLLAVLLWSIGACRERDHESLLDGTTTMALHNVLRLGVILWDTSNSKLSIEKAFNGFFVTITMLYMAHVVMATEGFRKRDCGSIIASRVHVRWAGAFEVVMALALFLTLNSANESERGSNKWYLFNVVCLMFIPAPVQYGKGAYMRISGFVTGMLRVFVFPIKAWTPVRFAHAASVLVNHVDLMPLYLAV